MICVCETIHHKMDCLFSSYIGGDQRHIISIVLCSEIFHSIVNFVDDMSLISANMGKSRLFIIR